MFSGVNDNSLFKRMQQLSTFLPNNLDANFTTPIKILSREIVRCTKCSIAKVILCIERFSLLLIHGKLITIVETKKYKPCLE